MKSILALTVVVLTALASASPPACAGDDSKSLASGELPGDGNLLEAGADVLKGLSLSNADLARLGADSAKAYDASSRIAPSNHRHAQRLARLTSGYTAVDGLRFNYKVYLSSFIGTFALPDGSIRVHGGLMDAMTDDELRFVIGHEIGHVKHGHARASLKTAYLMQSARHGVASRHAAAGELAESELRQLVEDVIQAHHPQKCELESDRYGLALLKRNKLNARASVSAMRKLDKLGGKTDGLSSHPAPSERVQHLELAIAK